MGVILNNKKIIEGANIVCNAVKLTLGQEGGTFIIDNLQHPLITKDGVTICKEIHLEDKEMNMGASLVQEAALKTVKEVGDGTSTTCTITQALINKGQALIDSGISHVDIREGVLQAKNDVLKELDFLSRKTTKEDIYRVAKVAANGDEEVAQLISEAYNSISEEGMIEVVGTAEEETKLEIVEGLKVDKGWISPHFITDQVKHTAVLTNVKVLIVDGNIPEDFPKLLMSAIKECEDTGSSLFIICDEIHNTALGSLIKNKLNKALSSCVIKNPVYGKGRTEVLQDLEAYTGAKMLKINADEDYILGNAERVVVNEYETIIQRKDNAESLDEYIALVKQQENSEKRLSNLSSNLATIFVGGATPSEMSELKDRIDDAVLAVKSALESGVVAGGGATFEFLSRTMNSKNLGYSLLLSSIRAPYQQILKNAGIKSKFLQPLPKIKKYGNVFNVKTRQLEYMETNGILDSTKALTVALESAVSVSILILSTKGSLTI